MGGIHTEWDDAVRICSQKLQRRAHATKCYTCEVKKVEMVDLHVAGLAK